MSVTTNLQGNLLTIRVEGKFDIGQYESFNAAYQPHLRNISKVVVDLDKTTYLDSSALGMLLLLRERMGNNTESVKLINTNPDVRKILEIANFQQLFHMG